MATFIADMKSLLLEPLTNRYYMRTAPRMVTVDLMNVNLSAPAAAFVVANVNTDEGSHHFSDMASSLSLTAGSSLRGLKA